MFYLGSAMTIIMGGTIFGLALDSTISISISYEDNAFETIFPNAVPNATESVSSLFATVALIEYYVVFLSFRIGRRECNCVYFISGWHNYTITAFHLDAVATRRAMIVCC